MPRAVVGELVDGLPSRAWDFAWGGPAGSRHGTELAAWVNDRISFGSRAALNAGVRAEYVRASAQDNPVTIAWSSFLPRAALQVSLTSSGSVSFHTGYARFGHRLPLDYLAYGDSVAAAAKGITYFRRTLSPQDVRTNGVPFARSGALNTMGGGGFGAGNATDYQKKKQNYISAAIDVTHQLKGHEIKVGGSYQQYTVRQYLVISV